jgi:hypothetical protein
VGIKIGSPDSVWSRKPPKSSRLKGMPVPTENAALYSILRFYHAPDDRSMTAKRYLDVLTALILICSGMALGVQRIAPETGVRQFGRQRLR